MAEGAVPTPAAGGRSGRAVTTLALFSIAARLNRLPIVRTHRRAVLVIGLGLFFDLYETFLAGVLIVVFAREFAVRQAELPFLPGSTFVGMFLGAAVLTAVADRVGRRRAFLITAGLYSVASLVGALSADLWLLVVARFVVGFGIGAEPPIADTYLADLLPRRQRGRFIAWAYTIGFCGIPVGGLLARSLVDRDVLGIPGWRWMFLLGAVGGVIIWLLRHDLPESPRWLETIGKPDVAARVVARMEAEAAALGPIPAPRHDVDARPPLSLRAAFAVPGYRRRWLMLAVFHPLQSIGYYGFGALAVLVLSEQGYSVVTSLAFVAITCLGHPLGSLLSLPLIERLDRRRLIILTGLVAAPLGLLFAFAATPWTIMAFGFAYTATSNVFSNSYHVYQVEVFPTGLRARSAGGPYALGRLTIGAMPFALVPMLDAVGPGWAFVITGAALVLAVGVIAPAHPPTTGVPLEVVAQRMSETNGRRRM